MPPYKPDYISRKLFDKYQDRMDLRLVRIKEDYRNDMLALLNRLQNLEDRFDELFPIEEALDN